jgi:hypothetical protein
MKVLRHENFWKFLIIVAIGLAAGPEIVLAIEMRILLELLGVALFTTALVVGGELVLLQLRTWLLDMVMPPAHLALLRSDARIPEKAFFPPHTSRPTDRGGWNWWRCSLAPWSSR